jgi:hypothetical protein
MQPRGMSPDVDAYRNVLLSRYFAVGPVRLVTPDIALCRAVRDQIVITAAPVDPLAVAQGVTPRGPTGRWGAAKFASDPELIEGVCDLGDRPGCTPQVVLGRSVVAAVLAPPVLFPVPVEDSPEVAA